MSIAEFLRNRAIAGGAAGGASSNDPSRLFYVTSYGAKGGSTDDSAAVNAALAAIYANKGGVLVFPFMMAGYTLGQSVVVDVAQYGLTGASGITIDLGGNNFNPTHTGWCFDIKTNFFGANNGGLLGNKPVRLLGGGASIYNGGGPTALGGVRWNDTVVWAMRDVAINDYVGGTLVQLNITSNDLSTWVEHGDMSDVRGSNYLYGLWCKSTNPIGSFLGNMFTRLAFEGRVNNCRNFYLQGLMFNCQFNMCGGYYNQTIGGVKKTGGCCFYLDGGYTGTTFISPWVDGGGGGDQDPLNDIKYGPNYTNTQSYFPVLVNTTEINLPPTWRDTLLLPGVIGFGTLIGEMAANPREVLRNNRTYYVKASGGSDSNDGLTAAKAFATIAKAITVLRDTIDIAGKTVTIQLADGTYTTPVVVQGTFTGLGAAAVILKGNTTTPGNVIISTTSADAVKAYGGGKITLQGIKLQTTTGGHCLNVLDAGSEVYIDTGCQFGACAGKHMFAQVGGVITIGGAYTITGNAPTHYEVNGGKIIKGAACDATSRAFSANFANVYNGGQLIVNNTAFTITGSTGTKYYVYAGGLVQTYGAGTSIFPGSVAGFAESGQYSQYL